MSQTYFKILFNENIPGDKCAAIAHWFAVLASPGDFPSTSSHSLIVDEKK
jgi:hypothetical protein